MARSPAHGPAPPDESPQPHPSSTTAGRWSRACAEPARVPPHAPETCIRPAEAVPRLPAYPPSFAPAAEKLLRQTLPRVPPSTAAPHAECKVAPFKDMLAQRAVSPAGVAPSETPQTPDSNGHGTPSIRALCSSSAAVFTTRPASCHSFIASSEDARPLRLICPGLPSAASH